VTGRSRLFLGTLITLVVLVLAYDVWHARQRPSAEPETPPPAVPPAEPLVRRLLDSGPLRYEGEYLQNLSDRLRPALLRASPTGATAQASAGFWLSADGDAVIASAAGDPEWTIRTEGQSLRARLAGVDRIHGVALLRADVPPDRPPRALGMLEMSEGGDGVAHPLIAIRSGTDGVEARVLAPPQLGIDPLTHLETLDPHAGEVLVDLDGRLHGFATLTRDGVTPLPATLLAAILNALAVSGRHPHPYTGVTVQDIDPALRAQFPRGDLLVVWVEDGSPGARAGVRAGMPLAHVRTGAMVADTAAAYERMQAIDALLTFTTADPRPREIAVTVEDRQVPAADAGGVIVPALEPGVPIQVAPGTRAWAAGLRSGDLVVSAGFRRATAVSLRRTLADARAVTLTVRRGDRYLLVALPPAVATPASGGR
jgi:S1-C subfamily serine protease